MSNRTIVEFNHDKAHNIEAAPEAFVAAIMEMLRAGVNKYPDNARGVSLDDKLSGFGVTTTPTCHHSDDRAVTIGNSAKIIL